MNTHRLTTAASALAVVALVGCDGAPEPAAPATRTLAAVDDGAPAPVVDSAEASRHPGDSSPTERPHKRGGGAFGVGIRPSNGASGIVP